MYIDVLKRFRIDLEAEKAKIQEQIDQVDTWIQQADKPVASAGYSSSHSRAVGVASVAVSVSGVSGKSYIDLAEEYLMKHGDSHIKKIAEYIEQVRGQPTNTNALTASLESHLNNRSNKRIEKKAPATYGLPRVGQNNNARAAQ